MEILHEKKLWCRLSIVQTKCLTITIHYRTVTNFCWTLPNVQLCYFKPRDTEQPQENKTS